jgi:anthranilate synthase component 1
MQSFTDRAEFRFLARRHPLVPVTGTVAADTETPVSSYLKIARGPWSYLLESVEGGAQWGRYSLIGFDPILIVEARGRRVSVRHVDGEMWGTRPAVLESDGSTDEGDDPIAALRGVLAAYRAPCLPGLPRLAGGLVGYLGFGAARLFERLPESEADPIGLPDIRMFAPRTMLAFDNVRATLTVIVLAPGDGGPAAYDVAREEIERVLERLAGPLPESVTTRTGAASSPAPPEMLEFRPAISRERFEAMVSEAKEAVHAGEVVQVVLSQAFAGRTAADPFTVYRILRALNPSPYMFHLAMGEETVVGASPEVMVRVDGCRALLRPIAGTRPRGATAAHDAVLETELLSDEKERAEHVMLLDLGRNDLGRVAEPGGVRVEDAFSVERYSHVMHITSTVTARLRAGTDALDVLAATFPAGTVSGAPKVRALELINTLEPQGRGLYAGAVGYLAFDGAVDTCIAIRTMVFRRGEFYFQAGAGIVADSDPAREYEETMNKAAVLREALEMASRSPGMTHSSTLDLQEVRA